MRCKRLEVAQIFDAHEVAYSLVYDIEDIFADAQYAARETLIRVADSDLVEAVVQNVVPKFSETPGAVDFLGCAMGTHNDEVYRGELGYSDEKIARLREENII